MTRIKLNKKRMFDIENVGESGHDRIAFDVEDDDGKERLFIDCIELNLKQCRKLIAWLENAARMISECKQRH